MVARGDTLWHLAAVHLGNPERWPEIYELNREQIADPDQIDTGWVLALPSGTVSTPATTTSSTPDATTTPSTPDATPTPTVAVRPPVPTDDPPAPAPASPVPATSAPAQPQDLPVASASSSSDIDLSAVAAVGGLLAAGILGVLSRHRLRQLISRGLGRRLPVAPLSARRVEGSLATIAREPASPPPSPAPTDVVIGWQPSGDAVLLNVEAAGCTSLIGDEETIAGAMAAISSSLACAEWSEGVEQRLAGRHDAWATLLDDPALATATTTARALNELSALVDARMVARGTRALADLRADRDASPSWQPVVFCFCDPLTGRDLDDLVRLTATGVGVSAVVANPVRTIGTPVSYPAHDVARIRDATITPQLISAPARRALIELFRTAASLETTPAPWWSFDDDLPPNVTRLNRATETEDLPMAEPTIASYQQPTLLLLGPVQLVGTNGPVPTRSIRQCEEYCAWLLDNPGATPTKLGDALVVAEATRRSMLSRLRGWLGQAPDGSPYLPDAYTGRIQLHPDVTSDWELFRLATSGGVNRATNQALVQALVLVRGAPMADTPRWQWVWAEELRTDMASAVRDAGAVLAERALTIGDERLARWALDRALPASPDDELLLTSLIEVEERFGTPDEVKRLVMRLTRTARDNGMDLADHTIEVLERVMGPRRRARS